MKNIFNAIAIATLITTQCTQAAASTIEIYNKSNNLIKVTILSSQGTVSKDAVILANNPWAPTQAVDLNARFDIYITDGGRSYQFFVDAPGKTKYLSWDPTKNMPLYPQTGPLLGLMGKTKSGLPLNNNLSSSMIQRRR